MSGIKNFVLGFSVSLVGMSFAGHLLHPSTTNNKTTPEHKIQIELFKTAEAKTKLIGFDNINLVNKKIISTATYNVASLANPTFESQDGIEDDEILNINIDNIIPIELEELSDDSDAQILNIDENNNLVAMLPNTKTIENTNISPWISAESNFTNNKDIIQENNLKEDLLSDNFTQTSDNEFISYKVAEKIKQSILFPIPDEILNDENLTPTFIKKKGTQPNKAKQTQKQAKTESNSKTKNNEETSILTNITSWLKDTKKEEPVKKAPTYSSTEKPTSKQQTQTNNKKQEKDNFVTFYQTLQNTTEEYEKKKITPSELKLSFRPDRAEISGQTLRWIKAFSEKAKESNTFLQVKIDANAPIELQKKRLNLLYSIFMNNGVDLDKIDTIFSLTEANTFIIRILTTE